MTGLAGLAWFFYTLATNKKVSFVNPSIEFQLPILLIVIFTKLCVLSYYRFKTHKKLFKANVYAYVIFLVTVVIIDFKDKIVGGE